MDPRLLAAIGTPRIRSQATELVELALRALEDLKQLDESLYERFVANRTSSADPATSASSLRTLWDDTFRGLLELLTFCRSIQLKRQEPEAPPDTALNFDFAELDSDDPPVEQPQLDLGSSDIGDLLEGIDEHIDENVDEAEEDGRRWTEALETISSMEYGLSSQYADARARLNVALSAGEISQVLGLLDDTQSSASEGVHALVSAVYKTFLPEVDVATIVPGYLTSLGRALVVRRGLAQLTNTLGPSNDVLQSDERERYPEVLAAIRDSMKRFVGSVVCRAMRAADRWQMVVFERELSEQPTAAARQTSEGLVKYLDSLRSINQREVLVLHDERALEEVREAVASARQLADISPRTSKQMLERAIQEALRLRGRAPHTDRLLLHLEEHGAQMSQPELLERLEEVLASA